MYDLGHLHTKGAPMTLRHDPRAHDESEEIHRLFEQLITQQIHGFPAPRHSLNAPTDPGVYIIRDSRERVAHVGETPRAQYGLWQRLSNHTAGQSSFVGQHLGGNTLRLRTNYTYQYLVVRSSRTRALLECYAAGKLCPLHIHSSIAPDTAVDPA